MNRNVLLGLVATLLWGVPMVWYIGLNQDWLGKLKRRLKARRSGRRPAKAP